MLAYKIMSATIERKQLTTHQVTTTEGHDKSAEDGVAYGVGGGGSTTHGAGLWRGVVGA